MTLIIAFMINLLFEIIASQINIFKVDSYLYYANILRYLFIITLGLWIFDKEPLKGIDSFKIPKVIYFCALLSFLYLLCFSIFNLEFIFFNQFLDSKFSLFGAHMFLIAFYPLIIYIIAFKILPSSSNNIIIKFIGFLGNASYHIFLFQTLFFGFIGNPYNLIIKSKMITIIF